MTKKRVAKLMEFSCEDSLRRNLANGNSADSVPCDRPGHVLPPISVEKRKNAVAGDFTAFLR